MMDVRLPTPELASRLRGGAAAFQGALPFPHLVMDGFLEPELARAAAAAFPPREAEIWRRFRLENSEKLACTNPQVMPDAPRAILAALNGPKMLAALEALTGIEGLVADANLLGGGMHMITRGGFLEVHADFNVHQDNPSWDRRLNLLLYLNEGWDEAWGGHLELWERDMSACAHRITPLFNRMVVFETSSDSFHGHPDPIRCPPGVTRRSLAVYYYTERPVPASAKDMHSTLYRMRPEDATVWRRLRHAYRGLETAVRERLGRGQ